jgi:hypothetical protein
MPAKTPLKNMPFTPAYINSYYPKIKSQEDYRKGRVEGGFCSKPYILLHIYCLEYGLVDIGHANYQGENE